MGRNQIGTKKVQEKAKTGNSSVTRQSRSRSLRTTVANSNTEKNGKIKDKSPVVLPNANDDKRIVAKRKILFTENINDNATVSVQKAKDQPEIKRSKVPIIEPFDSCVPKFVNVNVAEEIERPQTIEEDELVDAICHGDEFGDGINLSIEGPGVTSLLVDNGSSSEDEFVTVVNRNDKEDLDREDEDRLMTNPRFASLVNQAVDRRIQQVIGSHAALSTKNVEDVQQSAVASNKGAVPHNTVVSTADKQPGNNEKISNCNFSGEKKSMEIKSPSDTTIYAPALNKRAGGTGVAQRANTINDLDCSINNQVAQFVEAIRFGPGAETNMKGIQQQPMMSVDRQMEEARSKVDRTLVEAERFKATVHAPKGTFMQTPEVAHGNCNIDMNPEFAGVVTGETSSEAYNSQTQVLPVPMQLHSGLPNQLQMPVNIPDIGKGITDDDFFHLTCFIEPSLIHKIEKGEFVELEKLLPKDRMGGSFSRSDDRLEWVQRDGGTYLVPANKDQKINGIRRWEQAFRAYATIYCGANPHRSKEIWQYISVINTAAASFTWDNVYNYDITFRHLMAFNPNRSWAVTYNQMWNLSMRDPLSKFQSNVRSNTVFSNTNSSSGYKGSGQSVGMSGDSLRKKSDYCWSFNRGEACRFGNKCKFIERCSYCDSPAHPIIHCAKAKKKGINTSQRRRSNNKQSPKDESTPSK